MNENKNIQESLRRQLLSRIITQEQYDAKIQEQSLEEAPLEREPVVEDARLRSLYLSQIITEEQYEAKLAAKLIEESKKSD